MVRTLDWKRNDDLRDVVHVIVQSLVEGKLVALPAETAYHVVASGLNRQAVNKLVCYPRRSPSRVPCVFLRSAEEANDYCPKLSRIASRVVNRAWPGPMVVQLPATDEGSLFAQLPIETQKSLIVNERYLSLRVAAHEALTQAMQLLPGPLVAAPLEDRVGEAACFAQAVAADANSDLSLLIEDGQTHFGGFATGIRVEGNQVSVIHSGVLDKSVLVGMCQLHLLMVCTGNTCRSPMAEAILKDLLRKKFPALFQAGLPEPALVGSAGLSAYPGGQASPEAMGVMHKRGLSLQEHQSRPVTERLLRHADLVLTMTNAHYRAIVDRWPEFAGKTFLLSDNGQDTADPFGGNSSVYSACAEQIEKYLVQWVERIDESWFPNWIGQLS